MDDWQASESVNYASEAPTWKRPDTERVIELNVGGKRFTTTSCTHSHVQHSLGNSLTATIFSRGPNFFTTLIGSPLQSTKDSSGAYFIDRNVCCELSSHLRTHTHRATTLHRFSIICGMGRC